MAIPTRRDQILEQALVKVWEYLKGDEMSRGLSGWEAEQLVRNRERVKAEEAAKARTNRHLAIGPGKDVSEDTALQRIQTAIRDASNIQAVKIWHGNEAPKNEPGIADLLGVYTVEVKDLVALEIQRVGIALAIEVKGSKGDLRGDQAVFLHRWNQAGAIAGVARCPADVDRIIREYGLRGLGAD